MRKKKRKKIEERLEMMEKHLANAEEYVAKNVNVKGASWLHFGDWQGKSGHPLWMKNFMIPTLLKFRAKKEKALENIENKAKGKKLTIRKQQGIK